MATRRRRRSVRRRMLPAIPLDLPGEVWKDIPGMGYQASSLGRIRGKERWITAGKNRYVVKSRVLREASPSGRRHHPHVEIQGQSLYVHDLVALAWLGVKPDGMLVLHFNDVGTDNRPTNLRYGSRSTNYADFHRNRRATAAQPSPRRRRSWPISAIIRIRRNRRPRLAMTPITSLRSEAPMVPRPQSDRCAVCGYWLDQADSEDVGFTCLRGQCRYHPRPLRLFDAPRAEAERIAHEKAATEVLTVALDEPEQAKQDPPAPRGEVGYWLLCGAVGLASLLFYILAGSFVERVTP